MKITVHGHRPACLTPSAADDSVTQSSASVPDHGASANPNANEDTVRKVNLGFFKLKIHRQTARQASLLAQLQSPSVTPTVRTSGTTRGATFNQVAQVGLLNQPDLLPPSETTEPDQGIQSHADARLTAGPATAPALAEPAEPARNPQTAQEYSAHWNEWAQDGGTTGGDRTEAANRMLAWLNEGQPNAPLMLC